MALIWLAAIAMFLLIGLAVVGVVALWIYTPAWLAASVTTLLFVVFFGGAFLALAKKYGWPIAKLVGERLSGLK